MGNSCPLGYIYVLIVFCLFVFLAHLSRRLIGELLVYRGIRRPSVRRQHFQTTSSLKPKLGIHAEDISLYINCVFHSGRIRTLVAMATYSSHRLIMGKEEIDNFFCLIGDILKFFLQKCLLSSPLRFI